MLFMVHASHPYKAVGNDGQRASGSELKEKAKPTEKKSRKKIKYNHTKYVHVIKLQYLHNITKSYKAMHNSY